MSEGSTTLTTRWYMVQPSFNALANVECRPRGVERGHPLPERLAAHAALFSPTTMNESGFTFFQVGRVPGLARL
jgi:hypothetical protein